MPLFFLPNYELRGGYVDAEPDIDGKTVKARVGFNLVGRNEFRKFRGNLHLILEALPFMRDVIKSASYAGRNPTPKHGRQKAFHTKMKRVKIDGKSVVIAVDIAEESRSVYAYSVNREGIHTFPDKKRIVQNRVKERNLKKRNAVDSVLLPSSKDWGIFLPPGAAIELHNEIINDNAPKVNFDVIAVKVERF